MTFYFAWVGGAAEAPFTLTTYGDVWGGSFDTYGSTWKGSLTTTGDIPAAGAFGLGANKVKNLRLVTGLQEGLTYYITGGGITAGVGGIGGTKFSFDGDHGGEITPALKTPLENVSLTIASLLNTTTGVQDGQTTVILGDDSGLGRDDTGGLTSGTTYQISGSGIPGDTFTTYEGSPIITISNPATATAKDVSLTFSTAIGRTTIKNLSNTAGLVVGTTYQIFGRGIPSGCLATFQSDGSLELSSPATVSTRQTLLTLHLGAIYPDGGAFDPVAYAREDETVLSVKIDHTEGNFPLLSIGLKNPRIGLLAASRQVWCWLSWRDDSEPTSDPVPLFHGRLMSLPTNIQGEKVTLQFIAQPGDYVSQQNIITESLKVAPFYDPIWLSNGIADATTILESRTQLWHIDRVTLGVSVSDITIGEDGTLVVDESMHLYNSMDVKYGSPPLSSVYVTGTVNWTQQDNGTVDITREVIGAFDAQGGASGTNTIGSYTGDGLLANWPKPGTGIGGGWAIGDGSYAVNYPWLNILSVQSQFVSQYLDNAQTLLQPNKIVLPNSYEMFSATYTITSLLISVDVTYAASRPWTEVVTFFLEADTQQIITDSRASTESFSLSSSIIHELIDPDGSAPLADLRYNSYFKTDRGQQSFQWLLQYAKAKLVARARAVDIDFEMRFKDGLGLSCRWNATVTDGRLPGGVATGKVKAYSLIADKGRMTAKVTIGCTIGNGGSQTALLGTPTYVDDGYVEPGYQAYSGGSIDIGDGSITYENFDDFVTIDDGINFFDMTPQNIIKQLYVTFGPAAQLGAIAQIKDQLYDPIQQTLASPFTPHTTIGPYKPSVPPDPTGALKQAYTMVTLEMVPVTGGDFLSQFAVNVSKLSLPKTIDLTASSDAG